MHANPAPSNCYTMAQSTQRRVQAQRPRGWRALAALLRPSSLSKIESESASQTQTEFENGMFKILTSACPVSDFHDGTNTPLARSAYQHAALQMMSVERGLLGIEALKQASASIFSENPSALGVELQAVVDSMQGIALEPYERDSLLFAREALAIASNPTSRFTVSDSITGALADTLNRVLNSEVCLSRFAKRESAELLLASAGEPSSSRIDPPRL